MHKDTCSPMFTAALFTIAKTWKKPKCPSRDEWIKKMWYIYTKEYYSAIRNDEIQPFVTTWMDLEDIMLSEISQREKVKYCLISLISRKLKKRHTHTHSNRDWIGGYQRARGEEGRVKGVIRHMCVAMDGN
uniref:DUF1725 domain-containing protein n=1 Tax=Equus caballus TaxID=9796 RepID=A0A9L0SIY3_HORSE